MPGRFRYDKENSDEEEDDYDDFNNQKNFSLNDDDDQQNSSLDLTNTNKTTYQNKYETYKMVYSKRFTSNDAYEPSENNNLNDDVDNITTNKSDLREYLRNKSN